MCRRRAGAAAGGGRRAGRFRVGSPAPPFRPPPAAPAGTGPGGAPAGSGRGPGGRRARVTPWTGGTLLSGALEAPGGGGQGRRRGLKCPHPAPRGSPGGAAAALGGGSVPASMVPPFPLPKWLPGPADRGAGIGDSSPFLAASGVGPHALESLSLVGETFPNRSPSTLLRHLVL